MPSKENADYLMQQAQAAGVTDPKELSNFMGQMQVESGGFKSMDENLHYSGERLLSVFPGRNGMTDLDEANKIAKGGPEAIANAIYGGKWGEKHLGNKEPGDGWKYHGRGYIQLTGHDRYAEAGAALGLDLVNKPELAADRENAAKISNWYWKTQVVAQGDQKSVDDATYDINSGGKGLKERREAAAAWEHKLEQGYVPGAPEPASSHTLKQGMHSESVQKLQTQLGELGYLDNTTTPDGKFGPVTTAAVKNFQHDHHLPEVGRAGPATQHAIQAELQPLKRDDPGLLPGVSTMSSLPAGAPGLNDPRNALNPDHELYSKLSTRVPDASEQRLLQFVAACHENKITGQNLGALRIDEETGLAHFGTKGLEVRTATVDIKEPSPPPTQSIQQIQQFDQHQVQINTQVNAQIQAQNAQAPPSPVMGGPGMGR